MYGQLYHRTISRELREPRRSPRGTGPRREWRRGGRDGRDPYMRQVDQAQAAGHKARSASSRACGRERPGSAGNIFAPCMISGPSTRKGGLDGKIRAPCILNRPIAPGNGRIGRGSCHLDLKKHAFRADVAREGAFFAHSARKGCMRRDSCRPGPRCRRNARDGRRDAAERTLFAQMRKHHCNALLQGFDKPLVHFEHLL